MLKRSLFFYSLLAMMLFKVNYDVVHYQRLGYLRHVYEVAGMGKDIPAGILYYDYSRRLDPADVVAWEGLLKLYLLTEDFSDARNTLAQLNTVAHESAVNRRQLLELYKRLGRDLSRLK